MSTLVTGASGFIGRHAVNALVERGHEVVCLVRDSSNRAGFPEKNIRFAAGDLSDSGSLVRALEGVTHVLHLASLLKVPWKPEFRTLNIGGTEALARAAAERREPPVLVVVSSLAAAGPTSAEKPHREEDPPQPISRYGRMKLDSEKAATQFFARVPTTIVRPPMVLGEGDRYGFELFRTVARGVHFLPSLADHRVSLVHAKDLSQALVAALERGQRLPSAEPIGQGVYYVADPLRPTYAELGKMVARACAVKAPKILRVPKPVSAVFAFFSELAARLRDAPTIMNLDKWREATAGSWICDPGKAMRDLSFAPCPVDQRLTETATWYKDQGWI